jgi:hypothetical protein
MCLQNTDHHVVWHDCTHGERRGTRSHSAETRFGVYLHLTAHRCVSSNFEISDREHAANQCILMALHSGFTCAATCRLLHCDANGWQQQYIKLHGDIVAGKAPPRFMLAYGLNGAPYCGCGAARCSCREEHTVALPAMTPSRNQPRQLPALLCQPLHTSGRATWMAVAKACLEGPSSRQLHGCRQTFCSSRAQGWRTAWQGQ